HIGCAQNRSCPSAIVWNPRSRGMTGVRRLYQHTRWRSSDTSIRLFRLLRDVAGRQRRAFAEEEVLHVLRHEILRFLLPWHQAVLVQDHLHAILPELPRLSRDVLVNPLAKLTGPWRRVEARKVLLKLDAEHRAAALIAGRRGCGLGFAGISHGRDCTAS